MSHNQKPGIFQVGRVVDTGEQVVITGWGLSSCAGQCPCHRHPETGQLGLIEDAEDGTLGLLSHRGGGCDCCEPWTAAELATVLGDLHEVDALRAEAPAGD